MQSLGNGTPERILESGILEPVLAASEIAKVREAMQGITIKEELVTYIVELVRSSRTADAIEVGAGPRATQALLLSSRAYAGIQGRDYVTPDDIRAMVHPVLSHRILLRPEYEIEGITVWEAVERLHESVAVPR